jgi:hypothetical protein
MLELPSAVTYYIARDPAQARRIVSSLAWVGVLQVRAVFVLQAAALAALVASDPPHVPVAAAISLLLPPGILALSFGVAILQGQRRFTAFNLLRILPSTACVAGVVIVYMLNATSVVLFMALWAAVSLIGGYFALAFAVRGLPAARRGGLGPWRERMVRFGLKAMLRTLSPVDSVRLAVAFSRRSLLGWSSRCRPDSSSPLGAEHSPNTLDHSSNAWPLVATRRRELIRSRMTRPVQDSTFRGASTMAASCCST